MKMKLSQLRQKIQEIASTVYIQPTEELFQRAEEELEKSITVEFVEKIRGEMVKQNKAKPPTTTPTGTTKS